MSDRFNSFAKMAQNLSAYAMEAWFGVGAKDKGGNILIFIIIITAIAILVALLYAGVETVFLLTRTRFGTKAVSKFKVVVSSVAFIGLSYFCYTCYKNYYGEVTALGSELSYLYATFTFLFIGAVVFFKGLLAGGKDDSDVIHPIYRGDSWLLSGMVKEGVSQSIIQDIAEPFLFLALGFCLFSYNYIWGLPFIFCAISCWFHLGVESVAGFFKERKDLSNEGLVYTQNRRTTKIIS